MRRLVGPHEKRAPAPLPRSLATQTLSCATRSFRCKARPNQCHAPQVGGRRWAAAGGPVPDWVVLAISCVRRTPGSSPASPRNSPWQAIIRRPNTRVRVFPAGEPRPQTQCGRSRSGIQVWLGVGDWRASCPYCCERWEGSLGKGAENACFSVLQRRVQ